MVRRRRSTQIRRPTGACGDTRAGQHFCNRRHRTLLLSLASFALLLTAFAPISRSDEVERRPSGGSDDPELRRDAERQADQLREEEERRDTPEARAERQRSRNTYQDHGRDEARSLARRTFPGWLLNPPLGHLAEGERIERYLSDSAAVVRRDSGEELLLESTIPLRTRDASGDKAPVDLRLQRRGDAFSPLNPLVPVQIPEAAGGGITLSDANVSVRLIAETADSKAHTLAENKVFYHEVTTDTDLVASATVRGAEVFLQLRSERSPESVTFVVDVPDGAVLRSARDPLRGAPGAEIVRGDKRLAAVSAPVAIDADGQYVPVEMEVVANRLVLRMPHRDRDLRYPVMIDPEIVEDFNFQAGAGADRWQYQATEGRFTGAFTSWVWGRGLYQHSDAGTYGGGEWGEYRWPAVRAMAIRRAEFMDLHHVHAYTCARAYLWDPEYGVPDFQQVCNRSYDNGYHNTVVPPTTPLWQQSGNYAVHNLWMNGYGYRAEGWMFMGWGKFYAADLEAPSVANASDGLGGAWHAEGASSSPWLQGRDPGIGIRQLALYVNGGLSGSIQHGCSGANGTCPEYWDGRPGTYNTSDLSEGANTITARTWDALWQQSPDRSWTVNVDKTRPSITGYPGAVKPNATLPSGTHALTVSASDVGQGGAPNSGVKRIQYWVDGVLAGDAAKGCGGGDCSHTFDIDAGSNGLGEGRHTVKIRVTDGVGKYAEDSFDIIVDRSAPSITSVSGPLAEDKFFRGETYELTVSARDGANAAPDGERSGVARIELFVGGASKASATWDCPNGSCDRTHTFSIPLTAENEIREGRQEIRLVVSDAVGHSAERRWDVIVDRSLPGLQVSGTLKTMAGQELPPGSYGLHAEAQDGSLATAEQERSGVTNIEIFVDGELVDSLDQACEAGSCSLSRDWTLNTADFPGGDHSVEVLAYDQVGQSARDSFSFSTRCCFKTSAVWGSWNSVDEIRFSDVTGDEAADVVGRDPVTGQVRVGVSSRTSFAAAAAWGSWPTVYSLELADVDADGRYDLVGRDSVLADVFVARSTGSGFEPPLKWGSIGPEYELVFRDVDGDARADLVGRNRQTGAVVVALSTGSAFGPATAWGSLDPAYEFRTGDADGDGAGDLVGRHKDTGELVVGLSRYSTFDTVASWGSLSTSYEAKVADLDGDLTADVAGWNASTGDVSVATSTEMSYAAAERWGSWGSGRAFGLADVNGDGHADLAAREVLGTNLYVSITDAVVPYRPSDDWVPPPDLVEEDGEPAQASATRPRMRLASQDDRRLLERVNVSSGDPFDNGQGEAAAVEQLNEIYLRLKQAGVSAIRVNVYWGRHQNRDGSFYWEKLDKAVNLAREQGMMVYMNLSGVARDWECSLSYNANGRACPATPGGSATPTGSAPSASEYATFVREAVTQFKDRVRRFSLWNEPNNDVFLRVSGGGAPAVEYRALYAQGRAAARGVDPKVMVWIGELTSHGRKRDAFSDGGAKGVTALEFLRKVAATGLKTEGVAWHPYQHARRAGDRGQRGEYGIGKLSEVQASLKDLADTAKLTTESGRKPSLFLTEFGYFNRPLSANAEEWGAGRPNYRKWHTEAERARWFPGALAKARNNRAAWLLLYHATENDPEEPSDDEWDSGLFRRDGEVTGERQYGKGPNPEITANAQQRLAYCRIRGWARSQRYGLTPYESGFTGCG